MKNFYAFVPSHQIIHGQAARWLLVMLIGLLPVFAQAQSLSIEVTRDKANALTCEGIKYTLKYSCAAGTGNCTNVTMRASAPSGVIFPTQSVGLTSDIASYTFSADRRSITFTFKEPLVAGNTGIIELTGLGECGKPEGTVATLTGSIQSGAGAPVTQAASTTLHSTNKFCPQKSQGRGLAVDGNTLYDISLRFTGNGYATDGIGTTSIGNVVMTDNLPANTVINSISTFYSTGYGTVVLPPGTCVASGSGTATPKVICTFPADAFNVTSAPAPQATITLDVTYPDASFNTGDNVTNSVTVKYTPAGGSEITAANGSVVNYQNGTAYGSTTPASCTAKLDVTDPLQAPNPRLRVYKRGVATTIRPGDRPEYSIDVSNTGNITLTNIVAEDVIPADLDVVRLNKQ
jgi:uncharacterized repeat protein (TIGR01451 family)